MMRPRHLPTDARLCIRLIGKGPARFGGCIVAARYTLIGSTEIISFFFSTFSPSILAKGINVYDESLEIINPAQQLELPIISLRYGVTAPPNPRLKAIFTNQHYGLPTAHGGISMICAETSNFVRRAPEGPAIANGEFRIKLHGLR